MYYTVNTALVEIHSTGVCLRLQQPWHCSLLCRRTANVTPGADYRKTPRRISTVSHYHTIATTHFQTPKIKANVTQGADYRKTLGGSVLSHYHYLTIKLKRSKPMSHHRQSCRLQADTNTLRLLTHRNSYPASHQKLSSFEESESFIPKVYR